MSISSSEPARGARGSSIGIFLHGPQRPHKHEGSYKPWFLESPCFPLPKALPLDEAPAAASAAAEEAANSAGRLLGLQSEPQALPSCGPIWLFLENRGAVNMALGLV